jgi:hypothetical protein
MNKFFFLEASAAQERVEFKEERIFFSFWASLDRSSQSFISRFIRTDQSLRLGLRIQGSHIITNNGPSVATQVDVTMKVFSNGINKSYIHQGL